MKKFLIVLLICIVSPIVALAEIDERKTDIYFANGIDTDEGNATANTIMLKNAVKDEFYNGSLVKMQKRIGKVTEAYNSTHGFIADIYESLQQKLRIGLDYFLDEYRQKIWKTARDVDLDIQITAYKESIKEGHQVLVVAHSQGNLFTYEAYRKIDTWMQNYFEAVSIASPGHELIKAGTPRISWHNNLVGYIGLYNDFTTNPVRITKWVPLGNSTIPPFESPMHTYDFQVPTGTFNDWTHIDFKDGIQIIGFHP